MIHNTINALGRYISHKAEVYEQTDTDIPQPKKSYLTALFAIMLLLMIVDSYRWARLNRYFVFAFELLAFTAFVVVVGAIFFVVLPSIFN